MNLGQEMKSISYQVFNRQMSISTDEFMALIRPYLLEFAERGLSNYWLHLDFLTGYDHNRSLLIGTPISELRERFPRRGQLKEWLEINKTKIRQIHGIDVDVSYMPDVFAIFSWNSVLVPRTCKTVKIMARFFT